MLQGARRGETPGPSVCVEYQERQISALREIAVLFDGSNNAIKLLSHMIFRRDKTTRDINLQSTNIYSSHLCITQRGRTCIILCSLRLIKNVNLVILLLRNNSNKFRFILLFVLSRWYDIPSRLMFYFIFTTFRLAYISIKIDLFFYNLF